MKIANVQIQSPRTFSGILLEREIIFKDRNDKGDMDGDRNGEEKVQRKSKEAGIDQRLKEKTSDDQDDRGCQEISKVSEKRKQKTGHGTFELIFHDILLIK